MKKRVKMEQITIEDINLTTGEREEIKLGNNVMLRLYSNYKNIKITRNTKLDNIKKIMLPSDKDEAMKMLNEGIEIDNKKYFPLVTSPSFMKKEDGDTKRKLSYLFIAEEDLEFRKIFMDICSLGKVTGLLEQEEEISINKDVVARLASQLSSSLEVNYMLRVLILPEVTYTTVENYYAIENKKLVPTKPLEVEHTFADGCGFMTPEIADEIGKQLGIDYKVDFAGLRWLMATKGLVVRCDFKKYFREMYKKTDINTDYFKIENEKILVKDCFNNWIDIDSVDLVLSETQTKWSKLYKKENEIIDINQVLANELKKSKYDKYRNTLSKMYITKVNKKEVPTLAKTNYQLIQNLLLTEKSLYELQERSLNIYNDLSTCTDVNKLRLFLGDIAREEEDELSASTKVHRLLQLDEENAAKLRMTRSTIRNNIKKKFYEIAGGEFLVESFGYLTATTCPITTLDWIMTRDLEKCNRGLKAKEFYINNEENREFVISRNPISVFSEIQKISTATNGLIEKYLPNLTKELIIYTQKDNTAMLMSGMDFDLDAVFLTWNKIILDSVVALKDNRNYINLQDSKGGVKHKFTMSQMFEDSIDGSGNLIGAIANKSSLLCNLAQSINHLTINSEGKFETTTWIKEYKKYQDLPAQKEILQKIEKTKSSIKKLEKELEDLDKKTNKDTFDKNKVKNKEKSIEQYKNINKKRYKDMRDNFTEKVWKKNQVETKVELKKGLYYDLQKEIEETKKKLMQKQYHSLAELNYQVTELSMLAIDQPKNLKPIDVKEEMEEVNKKLAELGSSKGRFMYYSRWSKNKENKQLLDYNRCADYCTALDINAKYIYNKFIKPLKEIDGNDTISTFRKLFKNKCMQLDECDKEIAKLYNQYTKAREIVREKYPKFEGKVENHKNKALLNTALNKVDLIISEKALEIEKKYTKEEIINSLIKNKYLIELDKKNNKKQKVCSSRFIINFCWNTVETLLREEEHPITIFKISNTGDFEWMDKKYEKKECKLDKEGKIQMNAIKQLQQKFYKEIRLKLDSNFKDIDKLTEVVVNSMIIVTRDGEVVGSIYQNNNTILKDGRDLLDLEQVALKVKEAEVVGKNKNTLRLMLEIC